MGWSVIRSGASANGRRRDGSTRRRRTGGSSRPTGRGGVPPLSDVRPSRGPLLAGGRCPNSPGRSMFVRLKGGETGKGADGKWTDAATGEHGDLLDVIRESCGPVGFQDVSVEGHTFLSMPPTHPDLSPACE